MASTAGPLSRAGAVWLEELLDALRRQHDQTGEEVWLLDATDQREAHTRARMEKLAELAARAEVGYWPYQPPGEQQDWNDTLAAAKGLPPYRDAHSKPPPSEQELDPADLPEDKPLEETPPAEAPTTTRRLGGRGR